MDYQRLAKSVQATLPEWTSTANVDHLDAVLALDDKESIYFVGGPLSGKRLQLTEWPEVFYYPIPHITIEVRHPADAVDQSPIAVYRLRYYGERDASIPGSWYEFAGVLYQ